jgi:hypothetical protein
LFCGKKSFFKNLKVDKASKKERRKAASHFFQNERKKQMRVKSKVK